jgi:hypothetical protein
MQALLEKQIHCPYCGEKIDIFIDDSVPQQSYIEDCQVCCRPINFDITLDQTGEPVVNVSHENE